MTGRDLLTLNLVEKNAPSAKLQENASTSWNRWEAIRSASGDESLFSDPTDRPRPKRLRCMGISLAIQALILGLWVVHSITARTDLPAPQVVQTFLAVTPSPPAPPPPPPLTSTAPPASAQPRPAFAPPVRLDELSPQAMPVDFEDVADDVGFGLTGADDAGVPDGVVGGLVGGLGVAPAPPPPPDIPTIYVVSGELERPDKLVHVDPVYPDIAALARVEGIVILEAIIDGNGNVDNVRVLRSIPLLDDAALDAVRHWKYEPTVIGGKPVPIQMTVTVKFALA